MSEKSLQDKRVECLKDVVEKLHYIIKFDNNVSNIHYTLKQIKMDFENDLEINNQTLFITDAKTKAEVIHNCGVEVFDLMDDLITKHIQGQDSKKTLNDLNKIKMVIEKNVPECKITKIKIKKR